MAKKKAKKKAKNKQRRDDYQAPKKSAAAASRPKQEPTPVPARPSKRAPQRASLSWWLLGGGIVIIIGLVIGLSVVLGEKQTGVTDAQTWDLPALDDANDPDGDGRITLVEFEGKPVVLNFFASWCTACEQELPVFRRAADDFADEVQIVFINSNETGNWRPMAERTGIDDQILIDDIGGSNNNGLYRALGGTGGMPMTAFYDAEGNVVNVVRGGLDSSRLYDGIQGLLAA